MSARREREEEEGLIEAVGPEFVRLLMRHAVETQRALLSGRRPRPVPAVIGRERITIARSHIRRGPITLSLDRGDVTIIGGEPGRDYVEYVTPRGVNIVPRSTVVVLWRDLETGTGDAFVLLPG